jgi:hypothetical protein
MENLPSESVTNILGLSVPCTLIQAISHPLQDMHLFKSIYNNFDIGFPVSFSSESTNLEKV